MLGLFSCFGGGGRQTEAVDINRSPKCQQEEQSTAAPQFSNPTLHSQLLKRLSQVRGATWLGRLQACAQHTAESFRASVRIYAFTGDGSRYVLVSSSESNSGEHSWSLLGWGGAALPAPLQRTATSVTIAAQSKAPLLHNASMPYKAEIMPADWQELHTCSNASAVATVPLLHGNEVLGAVLLSAAAGDVNTGQGPSQLHHLDTTALQALGLALSLFCVTESAEMMAWLARSRINLLQAASLQQAIHELCSSVTDYIAARFMLQATLQPCLLAEPGSGIACMVHCSKCGPSLSESGYNPSSAPQSLRARSHSRRNHLSGVRRVLAETSQGFESPRPASYGTARVTTGSVSGMCAAGYGTAVAVGASGDAITGAEELDPGVTGARSSGFQHLLLVGGSQASGGTEGQGLLLLRARTFKLTATMFRELVADTKGAPRGLVVEDCARHVQDVHKPTRDISMLIQSVAARSLILSGVHLSNGATLGIYVCFTSRLPLKLLTALHAAVYELLDEALRPCLDQKICHELHHEFDVLKAGVPGVYLATQPSAGANSSSLNIANSVPGPSGGNTAAGAAGNSHRCSPQPSRPRSIKSPLALARGSQMSTSSAVLGGFPTSPTQLGTQAMCEDSALVRAPSAGGTALRVPGDSGRGGGRTLGGIGAAPSPFGQVAKLDIDDALLISAYDSGGHTNGLESTPNVSHLTGLGSISLGGSLGGMAPPLRASSLIRVQELDGSTAIRNQMGVLVSSFQASLQDAHMDKLMAGRSSTADDLEQLHLVSLLGRGGNGIVLRGLLAQVAVAVKLIGLPDPEPGNDPKQPALRGANGNTTTNNFANSPPHSPRPTAGGPQGLGRGCEAAGPALQESSGDLEAAAGPNTDISPSEALSRRRELVRGAMELAVLTTTSHPCLVQVFSYYTNVVLEEGRMGPNGEGSYTLRRFEHEDAARGLLGPQPMIFTAVCMEWCDQGSLHDAICLARFQRVVPADNDRASCSGGVVAVLDMEAIYLTLLEVAMALRYLHSRRIIHRDIKPGNVLLKSAAMPAAQEGDTRGFNAKLADFGFALQLDEMDGDKAYVVPEQACGSVPYMAPETFRAGSRLDGSVDVYAFGIVMWEAVSGGEQPYSSVANKDIPREVYRGRRPTFAPDVPSSYRALAQACWAAQPSKRPTAAQLVSALKYNLTAQTQRRPAEQR